jgi:hypothetical protein
MALDQLELSLMAFPQRWDSASKNLSLNILILPVGDPTAPLGGVGPVFAGTPIPLVANLSAGLDFLPTTATPIIDPKTFVATPPAVAPPLFQSLRTQLVARHITVTGTRLTKAQLPTERPHIHKALPYSYKQAFAFDKARSDDCKDTDEFLCGLRDQAPKEIIQDPPKVDKSIGWGQVLSYALRQPRLARALGLIYSITLPIPAEVSAAGGFCWVALDAPDPANPWATLTGDMVKSYAACIPELDSRTRPQVFAARLFPVVTPPINSNLAEPQQEAEVYDDGFAQIMHSNQPQTIDAATLDQTQIPPGSEAGIQLGWDDEQVTIWYNAQVGLLHDRVNGTNLNAESPLGVLGYRVDAREQGGGTDWRSLCIVNGSLPFDLNSVGGGASTSIDGQELFLAPVPIRPAATNNAPNAAVGWLPLYFAQWAGSSLVLPDPVVQVLAAAAAVIDPPQPLPAATLPNPRADLSAIPELRYGHTFEFQVRLVDLTGGGPLSIDQPEHAGPAATTELGLLRFVPPKSLEVVASPPIAPYPNKPPEVRTITSLAVQRPRINYPEAVFAGVDPTVFDRPNLDNLIQQAWAAKRAISVADPDVDRFEVRVEARMPAHDTGQSGSSRGDIDGLFRVVYSLEVPFPAGDDPTVTLTLKYTDDVDIATIPQPADGSVVLPIPTARDIRVRLFPKCVDKPDYYGNDAAKNGVSSDYIVRQEAANEDELFPGSPATQLQAFYFQPGADIVQLLGQQLGLHRDGLSLSGAAGQRTVFGASGHIRNAIAGDASAISFSNQAELLGQWIVVLDLELKRDWTWDGFAKPAPGVGTPGLSFARGGDTLGVITYPRVVASAAVNTPGKPPDRAHTRVLFFDAFNPQPVAPAFPRESVLNYTVSATFPVASPQPSTYPIRLPVTTPPVQVPRIVSTGIAESPYQHAPDYSATTPRDRYLWVEFEQSIADNADDTYFGRVLAYGPDPLLAASLLPHDPPPDMLYESIEPPLPIDPELMRKVFSGQSADQSGLDAMTQLVPAQPSGVGASGTFYLLPLPPGLDAEDPTLFGFWTYEFRVGHATLWSTAQGRYGRPLRVSGLQHPAPHLVCSVQRGNPHSNVSDVDAVLVTAPYAIAVNNGNRLYNYDFGDPQTAMWFMLYTQALQADGASFRNILIDHRMGFTLPHDDPNRQHGAGIAPLAGTAFSEGSIQNFLTRLGLPDTAPLSVLAVEVLPGPLDVRLDRPHLPQGQGATAEDDPLGRNLGARRILRVSPLVAVPATC